MGSLFRKVVGAVEQQFQGEQVTGVVIGRPVNFGKKQNDVENDRAICSGLMNPDTNVGGKITTLSEVPDDQKKTFLYS